MVTDAYEAPATNTFGAFVGEDFTDMRSSVFRLGIAWMSAMGITRGLHATDQQSLLLWQRHAERSDGGVP